MRSVSADALSECNVKEIWIGSFKDFFWDNDSKLWYVAHNNVIEKGVTQELLQAFQFQMVSADALVEKCNASSKQIAYVHEKNFFLIL